MTLTDRRAQILRLIVSEYIAGAMPVGSQALASHSSLGLSSATIRNEMAALEEEGYITHPHTSAGRIPSDKGYRYYVEALMEEEELSENQKRTLRHQFHQVAQELETWTQLAATVLARLVHNVALVVPPRTARATLLWLDLVRIHDSLALLVLVLRGTRLKQEMLPLQRPYSQEELNTVALHLNRRLVGLTAPRLRRLVAELSPLEDKVQQVVVAALEAEEAAPYDIPYLDGLYQLLAQPEFRQRERVLDVLDVLDEHNLSKVIPLMVISAWGDVRVVIGQENTGDVLHSYSVVASRYGVPAGPQGVLGVLGPTRMPYSRTVPVVRYMASLLSELMARYYL